MNPTNHPIELANGPMRCSLRADRGGSVQVLSFEGIPVLRDASSGVTSVREMGCFPLVPFSNRVAKAQLIWQGTNHPLVKMDTPERHAIHGVAWQRPWQVLDASQDFAMLSYEHKADSAWPFAFDVSQTFKLGEHSLDVMLSITNQSPHHAPVGLGWHPQFAKRAGSHIRFQASQRWEMSEDKLPTHLLPSSGLDTDVATLAVDHCFERWSQAMVLGDALLQTRLESNLNRLIVFTNPSKDYISIEPVSHASNAMSSNEPETGGVRILASGESFTAQMRITTTRSSQ